MEKFMHYILIVLVAAFFTSIVFYAATVFFPVEQNKCYDKYTTPYCAGDKNFNNPQVVEKENQIQKEITECNNAFEIIQKTQDRHRLILIGAINILILIILLFLGLNAIGIGLFAGSLLSSIIATIAYYDSSSKIALILIVLVFVGVLLVISREMKNNSSKTETKKATNKKKKK